MKYLIIFLSIITLINSKIEDEQSMTIDVNQNNLEFNVGNQKPYFVFTGVAKDDQNFFDASDIEENTHFNLQIKGNKTNTYDVNCRLWKDSRDDIIIFFELEGELNVNEQFNIQETKSLTYNSKNVIINFNVESMILIKIEGTIPFLYGKSQDISVTEDSTKIELNFMVEFYNNEQLFLEIDKTGLVGLDNCQSESDNLKCEFSKENFDVFASSQNKYIEVGYMNNIEGYSNFNCVGEIIVNYPNTNKEDIYLKIEKVTNDEIDESTFFSFETNVTGLDKIKTPTFSVVLQNEEEELLVFS